MCFGDSLNDESMFTHVGTGVAMCNGLEHIKNIGKYVTEFSNEEDGVAHFIEKWVL